MKIEDRIQALKRSAKYSKDYKKYDEYRTKNKIEDSILLDHLAPLNKISKEGQKLCAKYKIPFPLNPDGEVVVLPGKQIVPAEQVIKIPSVMPMPIRKTKDGKQVFGPVEGRYLKANIDLTRSQNEIISDVKRLYLFYRPKADAKRNKGVSFNHWEIYDLVENERRRSGKINLLRVAKEYFDFESNPSYCAEANRHYMQFKRAYEKAERLMKEIEN